MGNQVNNGQKRRQFVPNHEEIEELEKFHKENHLQRFRIVLANHGVDQETADDDDGHHDAKQPYADFDLVCEHKGSKKHRKCQQMDRASLNAHPFDGVSKRPSEDEVQSPPSRQERVRPSMLNEAARIQLASLDLVKDRVDAAAAATDKGPIQAHQECKISDRPERTPITIPGV